MAGSTVINKDNVWSTFPARSLRERLRNRRVKGKIPGKVKKKKKSHPKCQNTLSHDSDLKFKQLNLLTNCLILRCIQRASHKTTPATCVGKGPWKGLGVGKDLKNKDCVLSLLVGLHSECPK